MAKLQSYYFEALWTSLKLGPFIENEFHSDIVSFYYEKIPYKLKKEMCEIMTNYLIRKKVSIKS